jgi:hypothetical protein
VHYAHFVAADDPHLPREPLNPMDVSYPPPVDQLLSLGDPDARDLRDYRTLGITEEHVSVLIQVMRDERLSWVAQELGEEDAPFWAPVHAWRALGQLRAERAVDPLIAHLFDNPEDDWVLDELPEVLGMIGAASLEPVRAALARAAAEPDFHLITTLANALREIAQRHPPLRDLAVGILTERLEEWAHQRPDINAWLISTLLDLSATEASPVMQAAFEAGAVADSITGDWEDAQVELGLLEKRTTPRPRYTHWGSGELYTPRPRPAKPAPIPGSDSAAAKARSLRKAQKQKAKRKRR